MHKPPPWIHSYPGDVELCQYLGMDGFTLVRLRKHLHSHYECLPLRRREDLRDDRHPRWAYLTERLNAVWALDLKRTEALREWLGYTGEEWAAMFFDEYPVDVNVVEGYSLLFGICEDFMLRGWPPAPAIERIEPRQVSRGGTT